MPQPSKKIEMKVNGFTFLINPNTYRIYSDSKDEVGVDFKFLTKDERRQVLDQLKFPR